MTLRDFLPTLKVDSTHTNTSKSILVIGLFIMGLVFGVLIIWGIFRFLRIKELIIIKKRYPNIVLLEAILATFVILFLMPTNAFIMSQLAITSPTLKNIISRIGWAMYPPIGHGLSLLYCIFVYLPAKTS